jgi:inner membrane protein involved in colicin E2 resistance
MIISAIAFFSLAALLGIFLLTFVLRSKQTPKAVAFTHGPLAAIGLVLLVIYTIEHRSAPIGSLLLFVAAAAGGFVLIALDLTRASVPKWLALLHGTIAAAGLILLLKFAF